MTRFLHSTRCNDAASTSMDVHPSGSSRYVRNPDSMDGGLALRRGSSILEVLIAIGIFAIGVLAALAVFPVAGSYMRKGAIADSISVNGTSAFHEFDVQGMRRPDHWMSWNPMANEWQRYAPVPGESYCIDPRFITRNAALPVASNVFPYIPQGNATDPRMRRITLWGGALGPPVGNPPVQPPIEISLLHADSLFTFSDDLAYTKPEKDRTLGAEQVWIEDVGGAPVARETNGEYSWLVTLVPSVDTHSAVGIATNDLYVLSVVMFHQRPMVDLGTDQPGDDLYDLPERVVNVDWSAADGVGGGPVVLTSTTTKLLALRPGQWICLAGNMMMPRGQNQQPVLVSRFGWYRVSDCDSDPSDEDGDGNWEMYATLIGRDWDVNLTQPRAFILEGVLGVYEKTIRLEYGSAM